MPVSPSQKRARNKWNAAHMVTMGVSVRRDYAELIKSVCYANSTTPSAVMRAALDTFLAEHPAHADSAPIDTTP